MTAIDVLQFFLAALIFLGAFVQRSVGRRFQSSGRVCSGDVITTKVGQVGLAITAVAAFALGVEALGWLQAGYQAIVMALLTGEALISIRIMYSAHLAKLMTRRRIIIDG